MFQCLVDCCKSVEPSRLRGEAPFFVYLDRVGNDGIKCASRKPGSQISHTNLAHALPIHPSAPTPDGLLIACGCEFQSPECPKVQ